jgi:oxygen-independent coproporphyrinogen III oxidase
MPIQTIPFGIYIHIPYCLQRCTYCDFATYEQSKIMPPAQYLELLKEEIQQSAQAYPQKELATIYFGGGTPSLLPGSDIVSILDALANAGFTKTAQTEMTIEINPATLTAQKMETYLNAGMNRFSVGAQTFDDRLLKSVNREHNAQQTRETLTFLKSFDVNYSFDVLFALPTQTVDGLKRDLDEVLKFRPQHVSPYCLTVPEGHILSKNRPLEDDQIAMFDLITSTLKSAGYEQYEISNFALPGYHSRHNSLYWDDSAYWGIGLSAHSYAHHGPWGRRYWNPNSIGAYETWIQSNRGRKFEFPGANLPDGNFEDLEKHQSLTDFCHTRLRTMKGLSEDLLETRFGAKITAAVIGQLKLFSEQNLVTRYGEGQWRLTEEGLVLSNQVFAGLTYLQNELP